MEKHWIWGRGVGGGFLEKGEPGTGRAKEIADVNVYTCFWQRQRVTSRQRQSNPNYVDQRVPAMPRYDSLPRMTQCKCRERL
jgi:hypothetical protein